MTKSTKSYHHGNLKQELINCACRLCEENGYETLSMRSIAKESGVSQTAPYRHFDTKESLYASVAMEGFKKLSAATNLDTSKKSLRKI
jgi:AcrR family transcriptional regulator